MPVQIPVRNSTPHGWDGPRLAAAGAGAAGLASFATAMWILPHALVLPAFSILAVAAAAAFSLLAWRQTRARDPDRVTYWDLAGAATLVGIFAALLSDPQQVLPLLEAHSR